MPSKQPTSAELWAALEKLTPLQRSSVQDAIMTYALGRRFWRNPTSDLITNEILESLGDRLVMHHATSRQALSKDKFEFAFEAALKAANVDAELTKSRTHPGQDIKINGVPFNLKTEAAANIKMDYLHVSKWMELGKGAWDIAEQHERFLHHLKQYDRILSFRRLSATEGLTSYELVEIPKDLLLRSESVEIKMKENSKQALIPATITVLDDDGGTILELYFDAGSERKLQVKKIAKAHCIVHATWSFGTDLAA